MISLLKHPFEKSIKVAPPNNKYTSIECTTALLSVCIIVTAINSVLLNALIKLNILTTGILFTIKFAADGFTTMGLKKSNLIIGKGSPYK